MFGVRTGSVTVFLVFPNLKLSGAFDAHKCNTLSHSSAIGDVSRQRKEKGNENYKNDRFVCDIGHSCGGADVFGANAGRQSRRHPGGRNRSRWSFIAFSLYRRRCQHSRLPPASMGRAVSHRWIAGIRP